MFSLPFLLRSSTDLHASGSADPGDGLENGIPITGDGKTLPSGREFFQRDEHQGSKFMGAQHMRLPGERDQRRRDWMNDVEVR